MMIAEIEDHQLLDDSIPEDKGYYATALVMNRNKRLTRRWEILVRRKDGSSDWIILKDIKDTYHV